MDDFTLYTNKIGYEEFEKAIKDFAEASSFAEGDFEPRRINPEDYTLEVTIEGEKYRLAKEDEQKHINYWNAAGLGFVKKEKKPIKKNKSLGFLDYIK